MRTEEEMLLFFEEEEVLVSATLQPQKLSEAPAIASVIKEGEIRNMGARDIMDILNKIPGIHITKGYYGKEEIEIRGIKTVISEKVKLLIDGHSVNNNLSGGPTWAFDSLTVDNIKRIEIIRGPGSALYGSNAFSAVINVITKDGKDMDGVLISGGGGSFNTRNANLQAGKDFDNYNIAFYADYFKTDGAKLTIESDDLGTAGDAPGKTKDFEEKIDTGLKLSYKDFSLNSKYLTRRKGVYLGILYALNDESKTYVDQYFVELKHDKKFTKSKISSKLYYDEFHWETKWELQPESKVPPEGVIAIPSAKERTKGVESQFDYQIADSNILTLGILWEKREQYEVKYKANYHPVSKGLYPSGEVRDVTALGNWNQEKSREVWATYLQDVWSIRENVDITLGVRNDHYSDFGETTNPRAAMVWKFSGKWIAKLLYGTAFRAPSFEELYNKNNDAVIGNQDLDPEKMTTYEVSIGNASTHLTYFNNIFKDKVELKPYAPGSRYENGGGAKIWGIEFDGKINFSKNSFAYLNYTHQNSEDDDTGARLPDITANKANIGINTGLGHYLNLNTNIHIHGERPRASGDPRSSSSAYELVDLTLIAENFIEDLSLRASIHNLLDRDYKDPAPLKVYNDFPREGVSYTFDVQYKF